MPALYNKHFFQYHQISLTTENITYIYILKNAWSFEILLNPAGKEIIAKKICAISH